MNNQDEIKILNQALAGGKHLTRVKGIKNGGIDTLKTGISDIPDLGVRIADYAGRIFKHNKMCIVNGQQITVAKKGQRFEEINSNELAKVGLSEADFE